MELTLEEFILKYSDYARVIASKFMSEVKDYVIDFEDLYQTGCLALVECYNRYDKQKASYSVFAYNNIYYAILNYINDNCYLTHVPDSNNYLATYIRKKQMEFYLDNGRTMTLDEMLELLNNCPYKYNMVINEKRVILLQIISMFHYRKRFYYGSNGIESYDLYDGQYDENIPFEELIISEESVEDKAINNVFIDEIRNYLDELGEKRKNIFIDVIGLNDGICKTNIELSKKYGISHQSIGNNYRKVLEKLQSKF